MAGTLSEFRVSAPRDVPATGWLGFAGASDAEIAGLEQRLGNALPPSYRAFLRVANGWRNASPFIDHMWPTQDVQWLSVRNQHLIDIWTAPDMFDG